MTTQEALYTFLDSDNNEHGLDSISTHGFLCATIVGPELPNWETVLFESEQESLPNGILSAIQNWREEILAEIKEHETIALPILADENDDAMDISVESELGDWCAGFIDAMYANDANDWFETAKKFDSDEDEIATLTLPMVIFSGIEEDDPDLQQMRKSEELMEEMADSISKNLSELYLIFQMPQNS